MIVMRLLLLLLLLHVAFRRLSKDQTGRRVHVILHLPEHISIGLAPNLSAVPLHRRRLKLRSARRFGA